MTASRTVDDVTVAALALTLCRPSSEVRGRLRGRSRAARAMAAAAARVDR